MPTKIASAIAVGTIMLAHLSATREIGAFLPSASSTSFAILDIVISASNFVTLTSITPDLLKVPPNTLSPSPSSANAYSPVTDDWSTDAFPLIISPSTLICSPAFITTMSPTCICSSGLFSSPFPTFTNASFGIKPTNLSIPARLFFTVKSSIAPPIAIKNATSAATKT